MFRLKSIGFVALSMLAFAPLVTTVAHADGLPANTSTQKNSSAGSVSGKSDATVKVEDGYLTLNAVPDMNFGITAQSDKPVTGLALQNNQGIVNDDGNDAGLLSVTDSRSETTTDDKGKTTTKTMPWQLTASLGTFTSKGDSSYAGTNGWNINLKQSSGKNTRSQMPELDTPQLQANGSARQIMKSAQGNGTGTTDVYYNSARTATLDMPQNVSADVYDAPITWTLNATPDSSVN